MQAAWLSAPAFARVARVSRQGANKALRRAYEGHPWRGHPLDVRKVRGRGGNGGWAYEVRADSLPEELRAAALAHPSPCPVGLPAQPPAAPAPARAASPVPAPAAATPLVQHDFSKPHPDLTFRLEVIRPILGQRKRTPERERAIRDAARDERVWPSGRRASVSERTIRRWLARYNEHGEVALLPRRRADRGRQRVYIGRSFDKAVMPALGRERFVAEIVTPLEAHRRSLWQQIPKGGRREVTLVLNKELRKLIADAGFDPGKTKLHRLCRVGRRFVLADRREDQAVGIYRKDPAEWHNNHRPRIRRSVDGLKPMDLVISDWHHLDAERRREDRSVGTPKLIAWQDMATGRMFRSLVALPQGQGVRREHIAESFLAMLAEPGWGLPRCILRDNGPEYNMLTLIADAMDLSMAVRLSDEEPEIAALGRERTRALLTQIPYNPQSKPIEGQFGNLERGALALMPGYIGGDRLNKRGAHAGKKPTPYAGSWEDFQRDFGVLMEAYEITPQQGNLRGRSPRQVFADFVVGGWKWQPVDAAVFLHAMAYDELRTVHRGQIKVGGDFFTANALMELPAGTKVRVRRSIFGVGDEIPVTRQGADKLLCMARRKPFFGYFDGAGAKESARGLRGARGAIAERSRLAHPVDLVKEMDEVVATRSRPRCRKPWSRLSAAA